VQLLLYIAGAITAVGAAIAVIAKGVRWMLGTVRKLSRLADDLLGEPARAGQPGRPGLMQRVSSIEQQLAAVQAELHPNGGNSMKDQLTSIAKVTGADRA
jgi:hypothetical protein